MKSFIVSAVTDQVAPYGGVGWLALIAVFVWLGAIAIVRSERKYAARRRLVRLATLGVAVGTLVWWLNNRKNKENDVRIVRGHQRI